jgi:hypothetical protein
VLGLAHPWVSAVTCAVMLTVGILAVRVVWRLIRRGYRAVRARWSGGRRSADAGAAAG